MNRSRSGIVLLACGLLAACAEPAAKAPETKGARALVAEATARIQTLSAPEAIKLFGDTSVVFVDLREQAELEASGEIPGAVHAPRGLLEFYINKILKSQDFVIESLLIITDEEHWLQKRIA